MPNTASVHRESSGVASYTCPPSEKPLTPAEEGKLVQLQESLRACVPHGAIAFLSAWQKYGIEINVVGENHISVAEHSIATLREPYTKDHFKYEQMTLKNLYGTKVETLPTIPPQTPSYRAKVKTLLLAVFSENR